MYRILWCVLGLAAVSPVLARSFPVEIIEQFDEARVVTFLDQQDLGAEPAWDPLQSPPPLSLHGAVAALRSFLQQRGEAGPPLRIEEFELRQIRHRPGRWHYLIRARLGNRVRYFLVLMSGKVAAAVQEPEAVK